jgi:hypothetical protein
MDTELSEQQWEQVSRVLDFIRSFPKGSRNGKEEPKAEPKQKRVNKRLHDTVFTRKCNWICADCLVERLCCGAINLIPSRSARSSMRRSSARAARA